MALLLTICFTNFYLTRSLFRHISEPLDELVAGVERIQRGDLDSPIAYAGSDEFKAACDAVDLMSAKLKAALEAEQRRDHGLCGQGGYRHACAVGMHGICRPKPAQAHCGTLYHSRRCHCRRNTAESVPSDKRRRSAQAAVCRRRGRQQRYCGKLRRRPREGAPP